MRPLPVVDVHHPDPPSVVLARLRAALSEPGAPCEGHVGRKELSLKPYGAGAHAFVPWASLNVRTEGAGTRIRGRIGPQPHLWTFFVALYAVGVFTFVAGLTLGFVQWTLDDPASGLGIALGAAVWQTLACGVDLFGRSRAQPQIAVMHRFLADALGQPADKAPSDEAGGLSVATQG